MIVRLRLKHGPAIRRACSKPVNNQELAQGAAVLLTPASVALASLGLWRLGSDLGFTSDFAFRDGFFSNWLVWIAGAFALHAAGHLLNRRFPDNRQDGGETAS